jgi:hypothetical protein
MSRRYLSRGTPGVVRVSLTGTRAMPDDRLCAAPQRPSYPAQAGYPVRRGASIPLLMPRNTGSPAFAGDDGWRALALNESRQLQLTDTTSRSRDTMRPSCAKTFARKTEGAARPSSEGVGNAGCPLHPQPACKSRKHTGSHHGRTGTPGIPARNGFNGLWRALPGDEFVLSPSSANERFCEGPVGLATPPPI